MRLLRYLIFFITCCITGVSALGQLTANFSADALSGCGSVTVTFSNLSTGTSGGTTYEWLFGDGGSSTQQNPAHIYTLTGNSDVSFTVTLTVTDGATTNAKVVTDMITVFAFPAASFEATTPTAGCVPLSVTFTSLSIPANSPIVTYNWDGGNGVALPHTQTVTALYNNIGYYNVVLNIVDGNGCSANFDIDNMILAESSPIAGFSAVDRYSCDVPFSVQFTDTTSYSGTQTLTYNWQFGDSSSSTLQNPSNEYMATGSYDVGLTVTDAYGCSSSYTSPGYVQIIPVTAGFTMSKDTSCSGQEVSFSNGSTGQGITYMWNFGDGQTSTVTNPSHIFQTSGIYVITLTTSAGSACIKTATDTLVVSTVSAGFTMDDVYACELPFDVHFTDTSSSFPPSGLTYYWQYLIDDQPPPNNYFYMGNGSDFTYTFTNQDINNPYYNIYDIRLIVTNSFGCSKTIIRDSAITMYFPVLSAEADIVNGCSPINTIFTPEYISDHPAVTWEWNFDNDDPPATSSDSNTSFQFVYTNYLHSNAGEATVELIVTNSNGCKDTTTVDIEVGIPPYPYHFLFSDSTYTNGEGDTIYYYDTLHSCYPPFYFPDSIPDDYCIGCDITTYFSCAEDTIAFFDSSYVYWDDGDSMTNDTSKRDVLIDSWQWDFGEPGGTAGDEDPLYYYDDTVGYMTIELIVEYNKCYDTIRTDSLVFIYGPIVKPLATPDFVCESPFLYTFTYSIVSADSAFWNYNYTYNGDTASPADAIIDFSYQLSDTIPPDSTIYDTVTTYIDSTTSYNYVKYDKTGDYYAWLMVTNSKIGCKFIDSTLVQVRDIKADFDMSTERVCPGVNVQFDASPSEDEEASYTWDFDTVNMSSQIYTVSNPITTHSFFPGLYYIKLTVADINGCMDDFTRVLRVYKPEAHFLIDTIGGCTPLTVFVSDTSITDTILVVSYERDSTKRIYDTLFIYDTLYVLDTLGILDTLYISDTLKILTELRDTILMDTAYLDSTYLTIWTWEYDNVLDTFYVDTAHLSFYTSTTHTLRLIVTDDLGCTDTSGQIVVVPHRPEPKFSITDSTKCIGDSIQMLNNTTGIYANPFYLWNVWPANDTTADTMTIWGYQPYFTFLDSGFYSVSLMVLDDQCDSSITDTALIYVQADPIAMFNADRMDFTCSPAVANFSDTSWIPYPDTSLSYNWSFGNGGTSDLQNPFITYSDTGHYTVQLTVETSDLYGCRDTVTKPQYIYVHYAKANAIAQSDTICKNDSMSFELANMVGVEGVVWDFGDGSISAEESPTHSYTTLPVPISESTFFTVKLSYWSFNDDGSKCETTLDNLARVWVHAVSAGYFMTNTSGGTDYSGCIPLSMSFTDTSVTAAGGIIWNWDFGNGQTSTSTNTDYTYSQPGTYNVEMTITSQAVGCTDSVVKQVFAYSAPPIDIRTDTIICKGDDPLLWGTPQDSMIWKPSINLSDPSINNPSVNLDTTTFFTYEIWDMNRCKNDTFVNIVVQEELQITNAALDTMIFIGETYPLFVISNQPNTSITWAPVTDEMSCPTCAETTVRPKNTTTYIVTVRDSLGCPEKTRDIIVNVDVRFTIDVPSGFSPNGDGTNDRIYVQGIGIEKLIVFQIFNRWGQLVYESDDLYDGWDGTFNGKPQNMDSYVFKAQVEYINESQSEVLSGYIHLIR